VYIRIVEGVAGDDGGGVVRSGTAETIPRRAAEFGLVACEGYVLDVWNSEIGVGIESGLIAGRVVSGGTDS
jgi:hypothetical protein